MNFKSDNVVGIHPAIIDSILKANEGTSAAYGKDTYSEKLKIKCSEIFETEVAVYLTNTGTAANCLGLSALAKPFETICCHEKAHINTDECGALGLFTGGAKLVSFPGKFGKIDLDALTHYVDETGVHHPHGGKPSTVSISQATECGTIYKLEEIRKISKFVKSRGLALHMDGARFANSLVTLGCSPAEATWKVGVDVMTFGATKNGTMAGEAIIFFNQKYAENFDYIHMRAGQLASKMRFFSCQFLAYLENGLWLKEAGHANSMAKKLLRLFDHYDIEVEYPVEANEIFVTIPKKIVEHLRESGAGFYDWGVPGSDSYRFLTSCFTSNGDLEKLRNCFNHYHSMHSRGDDRPSPLIAF